MHVCQLPRQSIPRVAFEQASFGRRGEGEGGGKGRKGKERKGKERRKKQAVWQPIVNMFRPLIQSKNTDQSAALFTQQLERKFVPQFVQDGIMCE